MLVEHVADASMTVR